MLNIDVSALRKAIPSKQYRYHVQWTFAGTNENRHEDINAVNPFCAKQIIREQVANRLQVSPECIVIFHIYRHWWEV